MHTSVAAVIKKNGKLLMLDRTNFPFGWACPAGHVESDESPEDALRREVKEEVNIEVKKLKLIQHEFIEWNECKRGVRGHDFFVYEVLDWSGEIKNNDESKIVEWVSRGDIKNIQLEKVWEYFLQKYNLFD